MTSWVGNRKRMRYSERKGGVLGVVRVMIVGRMGVRSKEKVIEGDIGMIVRVISVGIIGIRMVMGM